MGKFPESAHAHRYLDGLTGLEIGGSAHNPFGLKTRNIDYSGDMDTHFKRAEVDICGEAQPVDIEAPGNKLPLADKSEDFVVSSHVIEHFFDPIGALKEWARVARRYIYIICPLRDAWPSDRDLPITPLQELLDRHEGRIPIPCEKEWEYPWHFTRWTMAGFVEMCRHLGFNVVDSREKDDKVGNGFVVVIKLAGAAMVHVPHVLYHWRSHEASSSNLPTQNPGTVASTRAVLERIVAGQSTPSHYEIAGYPIYRGAIEWWIRRRPIGDPSFGLVLLGVDERSCAAAAACDSLARARTVVATPGRMETLDDWRSFGEALADGVEYAVVLGEQWRPQGEDWLWEAIKWFELQPDTAIVGGRLVDDDGVVVDAGLGRRGHQVLPVYRGLRRDDPGAFALALKAQTNYAPAEGFFVGHQTFLRSAVESALRHGFSAPFAATLGALARTAGRRVVYSPLLEARRQHTVRVA